MAFTFLFQKFKENCYIENTIIDYYRKNNEFVINIYCLNKGIDLQKEKDRLMILHLKHELGFDLTKETKIISIRPTYFSTFVFSFKKKKINSFFPCINFL